LKIKDVIETYSKNAYVKFLSAIFNGDKQGSGVQRRISITRGFVRWTVFLSF